VRWVRTGKVKTHADDLAAFLRGLNTGPVDGGFATEALISDH
jgi:hypothetical protein